jgi:choline dehydrogenase-like flavoprotein
MHRRKLKLITMGMKLSNRMATSVYDVCVVGSGPGGGIASYALTRAGLKVALVEAGPRLRAGIDL